jgi:hypothetical protein
MVKANKKKNINLKNCQKNTNNKLQKMTKSGKKITSHFEQSSYAAVVADVAYIFSSCVEYEDRGAHSDVARAKKKIMTVSNSQNIHAMLFKLLH